MPKGAGLVGWFAQNRVAWKILTVGIGLLPCVQSPLDDVPYYKRHNLQGGELL